MNAHITIIAAASILVAAVSCSKESFGDRIDDETVFTASGTVHVEDNGNARPAPISGIRVVMTSYNLIDLLKVCPIERDTVITDKRGRYETTLGRSAHIYYDLVAEDTDGEDNGGEFETYHMDKIVPGKESRLDNILLYMKRK